MSEEFTAAPSRTDLPGSSKAQRTQRDRGPEERPEASVVMPSRGRAQQAAECVERLLHASRGYRVEVIVVTDDVQTFAATDNLATRVILQRERTSAPMAWHEGAAAARADVLVLGADDLWFGHGWLGETLDRMADFPDGEGLVGFNDLARNGNELATHWAVHRAFARKRCGGALYPPCYQHFCGDDEMTARAKAAGRFTWAQFALVEHRHPLFLKAELDVTYLENGPRLEADRQLFAWRQEQGWPEAWEAAF